MVSNEYCGRAREFYMNLKMEGIKNSEDLYRLLWPHQTNWKTMYNLEKLKLQMVILSFESQCNTYFERMPSSLLSCTLFFFFFTFSVLIVVLLRYWRIAGTWGRINRPPTVIDSEINSDKCFGFIF